MESFCKNSQQLLGVDYFCNKSSVVNVWCHPIYAPALLCGAFLFQFASFFGQHFRYSCFIRIILNSGMIPTDFLRLGNLLLEITLSFKNYHLPQGHFSQAILWFHAEMLLCFALAKCLSVLVYELSGCGFEVRCSHLFLDICGNTS